MIGRPINLDQVQDFAIRQTYLKMFKYMKQDFMGRQDCRLVHGPGNIVSPTTGGPVVHTVFQGGHSLTLDSLEQSYRELEEVGDVQVESVRRTGEGIG